MHVIHHSRRLGFAVLGAILALALVSTAWAASGSNPKADIEAGNGYCGADVPSLPVVGFVNYHRTGDTVSIEYHLKDARPNEAYTVELWGNGCTYFGTLGTVTTNGNGVANFNGSIDVPHTSTRFFATAWNNSVGWNDTPAVTLQP